MEPQEKPISIKDFQKIYGSRNFLYDLINKGILTPRYLGSKPFFYISEINAAMTPKPTAAK